MRLFAETLASKRTLRALRESLKHNEELLGRTAATLQETEAQKATLRVILDNLPLGVAVVHGETGERELVNRRGLELLGDHGTAAQQITRTQSFAYAPGAATPIPPSGCPTRSRWRPARHSRSSSSSSAGRSSGRCSR